MTNFQAVIIALGIILAGAAMGVAQQLAPNAVNGCIYFATPPTLTDRQTSPFICDSTGKLRVNTT